MNTTQPETRRGRPPKEERRRKSRDSAELTGRRLGVNKSALDFDRFAYRWINDSMSRVRALTKEDDWDIVTQSGGVVKEDGSDMGEAVSQIVGTAPDGSALRAYLCRKPRRFYDEDQAGKKSDLDVQLENLKRGLSREGTSQSDYVPSGGIQIGQ